jgi:hypothetical protein
MGPGKEQNTENLVIPYVMHSRKKGKMLQKEKKALTRRRWV